jgi:hypothetical protein
LRLGTVSSIINGATGIGDKNADGGGGSGATRCVGISGCCAGASGGTKIGGGGALCIGIGSDGAAAIALRASLPQDLAAGGFFAALPHDVVDGGVNVVGNDEIARGLANGITEPECVSGAAIPRGLSVGCASGALGLEDRFEGIRATTRCKTIAIARTA